MIKNELCVGCGFCMLVCPYGVPQLKRDGKIMVKCDLCFERLERGMEPACVEACPTHALKFKTLDEIEGEVRERASLLFRSPYS